MTDVPTDRKYSRTHEWFKQTGESVMVGITQFAADELTDITFVDLPDKGTQVQAGKEFGEIESVKATSELVSALDGEVIEINALLNDSPELVNSDPFEGGWMIKLRVSNVTALDELMDASAYQSFCVASAH